MLLIVILLETFPNLNYFVILCSPSAKKNPHPAALQPRLLGIAELGFVPVY